MANRVVGTRSGWTKSTHADKIVLDFHQEQHTGKWHPPIVPGIKQAGFEIPSGGVSVNGKMYVVFTTDHTPEKIMGRSVVASSADDGAELQGTL